jgi:hypothetical protein
VTSCLDDGFDLGCLETAVAGGKLAAFSRAGGSVDDPKSLTFLHRRARKRAKKVSKKGIGPMLS